MGEIKTPKDKIVRKAQIRYLGPVSTLEEYVQPDWWRRIFNSLYFKTDADVIIILLKKKLTYFLKFSKYHRKIKFLIYVVDMEGTH